MNLGQMLHVFFTDNKVYAASIAITLDLLLGSLAAWKIGKFRLSYLSEFMRAEVAGKLFPYFLVYGGAIVAGNAKILIPGLDLGDIATGLYGIMMLSWASSILGSLRELRVTPQEPQSLTLAVAGPKD